MEYFPLITAMILRYHYHASIPWWLWVVVVFVALANPSQPLVKLYEKATK